MMVTLFLLSGLCLGQFPEPVHAIYGVHPLKGTSHEETARTLKNLGVNAAFIEPDSSFMDILHREGMKVFVEVPIFAGASFWRSHPETRPIDSEGRPIERREWYAGLCPTNPWLREKRLKEVESVLRKFPIDGLWLDFIRYPCHWEVENPILEETCFCPNCLARFEEDTGISIPEKLRDVKSIAQWILENHPKEWIVWRCDQIAQFVREARDILSRERPDAVLGVFLVPWTERDYDNAIESVIGQDLEKLKESVDVFSPMAYHRMCGRPTEWIGEITDYVSEKTGKAVLPIVQASDVSREELQEAIQRGLSAKSEGVILFSLKWLLQEGNLPTVKEAFEEP